MFVFSWAFVPLFYWLFSLYDFSPIITKEKSLKPYLNNEKPRFYLLYLDEKAKLNNSLLDSFIVDFKYFFSADMSQFTKEKYVASIKPFYREELSHNFASYLSRIGIPINDLKI